MKNADVFWAIIFSVILLAGCSGYNSQSFPDNLNPAPQYQRLPGQERMNLTDAQMQDAIQQRQEQAKTACAGKKENNSCWIENLRGNMTGMCRSQNETQYCVIQMPTRAYTQRGDGQ
jgi:hypothetical protein